MNHLGLFEGIGGFSLAAHWAGWHTVAWCEINEFCQKVLSYHFPNATKHEDIKRTDFSLYRGRVDIITGGFPCQPYSTAGKRLGKEDERHLWPEMLRAIREIRPKYVVGENVSGLISWSGGLVFDEVQADLEAEGYEVRAFVLPACGVDAPHRRDRVWFVAYTNSNERSKRRLHEEKPEISKCDFIAHDARYSRRTWEEFPTESPICRGNDGLSARLDGITFSKWRSESLKAYGNAIVPQVAFEIFQAINEFELINKK